MALRCRNRGTNVPCDLARATLAGDKGVTAGTSVRSEIVACSKQGQFKTVGNSSSPALAGPTAAAGS